MKAGIKIYEYQPSFIHSKYIAIDGHWAVIGSANMDNRSRKINAEFVFGVANADFTKKIEQTFFADVTNADEIQIGEWVHRSPWNRFRELFAQLFIKQY
jgi:cardiolipin synthase